MKDVRYYAVDNRGRQRIVANTDQEATQFCERHPYYREFGYKIIKETRETIANTIA